MYYVSKLYNYHKIFIRGHSQVEKPCKIVIIIWILSPEIRYVTDQLCLECIRTPRQVVIILLFLVNDRNLMIHLSKWWKMAWGTRQDVLSQFHPILSKVGELLLVLH